MSIIPTDTAPPPSRGSRPGLVDADWLEAHLEDPSVQVIEVDVSPAGFEAGHVPGAVLWDIYTDLKDADYQLRDPAAVQALVRRSGIGVDTTVVFYGYGPAVGAWLLRWCGHRSVALLDIGRETWREQGRPWTNERIEPTPSDYQLGPTDESVRARWPEVLAAVDDPATSVVDVRSRDEFDGGRFWPSGGMEDGGRAGHVPGALHLPVDGLVDDNGSFVPTSELSRRYAGLDPDGAGPGSGGVITYCMIGARAATVWFVLTYLLGRESVRVYDGSWAEWGRTPDLPVER